MNHIVTLSRLLLSNFFLYKHIQKRTYFCYIFFDSIVLNKLRSQFMRKIWNIKKTHNKKNENFIQYYIFL